jgi:large subunit ribosomal protein L23
MSEERLMRILRAPRVSEKSTRLADSHRQFVFEVDRSARKPEIKKAVQLMFNVEVERVTVANVRGKRKSFGRVAGKRADWKKACVTLKPGHDIDFMGGD